LYPGLNILEIRQKPFHELMLLYKRTLNRISRQKTSKPKGNTNQYNSKNIDDRNDPEAMGQKYGYHKTKDGRMIPRRPAGDDWF
jgi:hypothetical protein